MDFFKFVADLLDAPKSGHDPLSRLIDYGGTTASGGHDHRTNRGEDRTPAQKEGDEKRRGPRP